MFSHCAVFSTPGPNRSGRVFVVQPGLPGVTDKPLCECGATLRTLISSDPPGQSTSREERFSACIRIKRLRLVISHDASGTELG